MAADNMLVTRKRTAKLSDGTTVTNQCMHSQKEDYVDVKKVTGSV